MSVGLLDTNVLIALAWPSHVHHAHAHAWFARHAAAGWATCPVTELGFVRISSNPKIIPDAVSPRQALGLLSRMVSLPHHVFWPDDLSLADARVPSALLLGHRQVTDAYLLGLAIRRRGVLVTFDRSVTALLPSEAGARGPVVVIPVG